MEYIKIGQRIKAARKKIGMTQQELAYTIEYSIPHISHVENGTTKLSVDFLVKTANALNVTADQLLCDNLENTGELYKGEIMEEFEDCSLYELKMLRRLVIDTKKNLRDNL